MALSRSAPGQLALALPERGLLEEDARATAVGYARAADETTSRAWREAVQALLASLGGGLLERSTEVGLQAAFLNAVFVRLLGYVPALAGRSPFTLSEHVSTEVDATEADATL